MKASKADIQKLIDAGAVVRGVNMDALKNGNVATVLHDQHSGNVTTVLPDYDSGNVTTAKHDKPPKPSKYRSKRTASGFASRKEEKRWNELLLLEMHGKITDLEKQVRFDIVINGVKVCFYKADFVYFEQGKQIVEDVKGCRKGGAYAYFRLKAKLLKAVHGIEIREI